MCGQQNKSGKNRIIPIFSCSDSLPCQRHLMTLFIQETSSDCEDELFMLKLLSFVPLVVQAFSSELTLTEKKSSMIEPTCEVRMPEEEGKH